MLLFHRKVIMQTQRPLPPHHPPLPFTCSLIALWQCCLLTFQPLSLQLYLDCWSHHSTIQSDPWAAFENMTAPLTDDSCWVLLTAADSAGPPAWYLPTESWCATFLFCSPALWGWGARPWWMIPLPGVRFKKCLCKKYEVCVNSTGRSATFICLSVSIISLALPQRAGGMDTVLIPERPVAAHLCLTHVSIKKILKPFQLTYFSLKINATTVYTVTRCISHAVTVPQLLLSSRLFPLK